MNVIPKPKQIEFLEWELGIFFHFGIRTFYEGYADWDKRYMPLQGFSPSQLDCNQWIKIGKDAGAKYAVFVTKHHDGFANWPSAYTDYSVAGTSWKNGKGDVVKEFVDACRTHELKIGLYYSPAEQGFKEKSAKEYDDYFIDQITELLTNYGQIDYLWFDGCGSENHEYDTKRIVERIRYLQPDILIFNMWDPDTRWVGNEAGYAHSPNYNVVNSLSFSVFTEIPDNLNNDRFLPVECDFRMRRKNWFFSDNDEHTVKSLNELIGIYYYSVGRGANMLINISPDRRGLLPDADSKRLLEFGNEIQRRFSDSITITTRCEGNSLLCELNEPELISHVILKEDLLAGQKVENFTIKCYPYDYGPPVTVFEGKTVGRKSICQFPFFYTQKIEIVTDDPDVIKSIAIYK